MPDTEDMQKRVKRCPNCGESALEVDFKAGEVRCKKCGYRSFMQRAK